MKPLLDFFFGGGGGGGRCVDFSCPFEPKNKISCQLCFVLFSNGKFDILEIWLDLWKSEFKKNAVL